MLVQMSRLPRKTRMLTGHAQIRVLNLGTDCRSADAVERYSERYDIAGSALYPDSPHV